MGKKEPSAKTTTIMSYLSLIIIVLLIIFLVKSCSSKKETFDFSSVPEYEVIKVDDLSLDRFIRLNYYIKASDNYTKEQIELIAKAIVEKEKEERKVSTISFVFYSENDDISGGVPSIGTGEWAPYGDWSKAMEVEPGDYSKHEYKFDFNKKF